MELQEFLQQTQGEVRTEIGERLGVSGDYPYPELVFAEVVMQHMSDIGMTFDPVMAFAPRRLCQPWWRRAHRAAFLSPPWCPERSDARSRH